MNETSTPIATGAPAARGGVPRSMLLVGAAIGTLIVIALIVVLVVPDRPADYAPGSPEATFQSFYAAWEGGDTDAAYDALSAGVMADLDRNEYRRLDAEQAWQRDQDRRLVLLGVDVTGERAVLHVRVDEFAGGGIGGGRYSFERSVLLVREDGEWRIDEPLVGIESVAYGY